MEAVQRCQQALASDPNYAALHWDLMLWNAALGNNANAVKHAASVFESEWSSCFTPPSICQPKPWSMDLRVVVGCLRTHLKLYSRLSPTQEYYDIVRSDSWDNPQAWLDALTSLIGNKKHVEARKIALNGLVFNAWPSESVPVDIFISHLKDIYARKKLDTRVEHL